MKPSSLDLNAAAAAVMHRLAAMTDRLRIQAHTIGDATVLDLGIGTPGSLAAGIELARVCLGDAAEISLHPEAPVMPVDFQVQVYSDHPVRACLGGQYAGWPVSVADYFAMASGPMRMRRGREEMLRHLDLVQPARSGTDAQWAVGVLEADRLPDEAVIQDMASQCGVDAANLLIATAPSTSIAGSVQVVARSVETALHKLHSLDFDLNTVVSASGQAPLPPPAPSGDTVEGIGRTNDAILYGGRVTLWVDADDEGVADVVKQVPSESSADYGRPFRAIFRDYDYDFYKVDPMLFSPGVVTMHNLRSGRSFRAGRLAPDVLRQSFGP